MELILWDEITRVGTGGVFGQTEIDTMGLPPLINFGSEYLKQKVVRDVVAVRPRPSFSLTLSSCGPFPVSSSTSHLPRARSILLWQSPNPGPGLTWLGFAPPPSAMVRPHLHVPPTLSPLPSFFAPHALILSGDSFIVNGAKKWITGGLIADFFTVAVRTGGTGMGGISLLLLEKGMPGSVLALS